MNIQFKCKTCGESEKQIFHNFLECEIFGYESIVEWTDLSNSIPQKNENGWWLKSEVTPRVKEKRVIHTIHPFCANKGNDFWALYMPALSTINGWDMHPEEIPNSAFVKCRLIDVLEKNENYAWLIVEVIQVILLNEANKTLPAKNEVTPFLNYMYNFNLHGSVFNDWRFYNGDEQSNLGHWILIQIIEDKPHLIAYGEWEFHLSTAYLCNIILSSETFYTIKSRLKNHA